MTYEQEKLKVGVVAEAARAFVRTYDEFFPDYPEACDEYLAALICAVDGLEDDRTEIKGQVVDLGDGHTLRWVSWQPDRELNPQFKDVPDDDRCGALVAHLLPNGALCESYIGFNPLLNTDGALWKVEQWDPLTLSSSLLCKRCGDHGFIREGKWVRA